MCFLPNAMAFDLLPSLKIGSVRAVICVRVVRKWEYRGGTDDGLIQHVDLVLVDEKGNSMYAEIPAGEVESKSRLVEETMIYVISRFRVSNAKRSFRPVAAQFMVEFTPRTHVSAAREEIPGFPLYAYRLTPVDDLKSRAGDTAYFLDVIGVLTEVSDAYTVQMPSRNRSALTRHIILRDHNYSEVKISLWGERATAFAVDQALIEDTTKPVVVLFVGGLMKNYQENYYLSGNTAARWYFNPQIPEARHLYSGLQDQRVDVRRVGAPQQVQSPRCAPAQLESISLFELNKIDPYDQNEDGYKCTVTIGRLAPNVSWWFASCTRCSKSCSADGAGYRCNSCSSTSFRFKYKVCFVALDGTDEADMICFGDIARQLIGKPVQQLLRGGTAGSQPPPELTRIVARRFTFAISLTKQSFYKEQKTYQVDSIVEVHGRHEPAPLHAQPGTARTPATPTASDKTADGLAMLPTTESTPTSSTPTGNQALSVLSDKVSTPALSNDNTALLEPQDKHAGDLHSSARKRLTYGADADEGGEDSEASTVLEHDSDPQSAAGNGGKKRPRSSRVAAHRTG